MSTSFSSSSSSSSARSLKSNLLGGQFDVERGKRILQDLIAKGEDIDMSAYYDGPLPTNCIDAQGRFDGESFMRQFDVKRIKVDAVPGEDPELDRMYKKYL